jgi:hypothetical protein
MPVSVSAVVIWLADSLLKRLFYDKAEVLEV